MSERTRPCAVCGGTGKHLVQDSVYWLSEEGRESARKVFDDPDDGNAVRPYLNALEELEATLRNERIGMREVREVNATLHQECDTLKARLKAHLIEEHLNIEDATEKIDSLFADRDRLREKCEKMRGALIWCSGSEDFAKGGKAEKGWDNVCRPLLEKTPQPAQEEDQGDDPIRPD